MSAREKQIGLNEAVFREVNHSISSASAATPHVCNASR